MRRLAAAVALVLALSALSLVPATGLAAPPVLWTAGGLDAGSTGAGEANRVATDSVGNIAIVSGGDYRNLIVTSYTPTGALRWRSEISPSSGTFAGDWVTAAPSGDVVAIGHSVTSSGHPIGSSLVRYAPDGTLRWRVDAVLVATRLVVDTAGNTFVAYGGQDKQLNKYSPNGTLLWSVGTPGLVSASSMALGPGESDAVVSGSLSGGARWITSSFDAATGALRWSANAAEGIAALDVVVDATRVFVTGQGNVGVRGFLTLIAYDRTTGGRRWRSDKAPSDGTDAAGLRIAKAPDGSLVVAGQAARGFLDWYVVAFNTDGTTRWETVRDGDLNTDEVPRHVLVTANGTAVVTGPGGPNLPGGYIPGVTVGYGPTGTPVWEAFSKLATRWATTLPSGDVCAAGGYDAFITCWKTTSTSPPTTTTLPTTTTTSTSTTSTSTTTGPTTGSATISGTFGPTSTSASITRTVGAGATKAVASTSSGQVTVTLRDAGNHVLRSKSGNLMVTLRTTVQPGTYSWTITGTAGSTFKLKVTYPN